MSIAVRFLGTSSARPTVQRSVSALALEHGSVALLIDCGEGTERQMLRYGAPLSVHGIVLTHLHADHTLGLPGLLRALALEGRADAIELLGPRGTALLAREIEHLVGEPLPFAVNARDLEPDARVECAGYELRPFVVQHRGRAFGYVIRHAAHPDERLVISGDTRPCKATVDAARHADLLIHEATFSNEEAGRARDTGHSTAREAAEVARDAGVKRLVLTHFSARFSHDTRVLQAEANAVFSPTIAARDGMLIHLDVADRPLGTDADGGSEADSDAAPGDS